MRLVEAAGADLTEGGGGGGEGTAGPPFSLAFLKTLFKKSL